MRRVRMGSGWVQGEEEGCRDWIEGGGDVAAGGPGESLRLIMLPNKWDKGEMRSLREDEMERSDGYVCRTGQQTSGRKCEKAIVGGGRAQDCCWGKYAGSADGVCGLKWRSCSQSGGLSFFRAHMPECAHTHTRRHANTNKTFNIHARPQSYEPMHTSPPLL